MNKEMLNDLGCKALGVAIVNQAVTDHESDILYLIRKCKKERLTKKDLDHIAIRYGYVRANRRFFMDQHTPHKRKTKTASIQYNLLTDIDGGRLCNAIENKLHFGIYEPIVETVLQRYHEAINQIELSITDKKSIAAAKESIIVHIPRHY